MLLWFTDREVVLFSILEASKYNGTSTPVYCFTDTSVHAWRGGGVWCLGTDIFLLGFAINSHQAEMVVIEQQRTRKGHFLNTLVVLFLES